MVIGNLKNNYKYYKGYEGEEEISFVLKEDPSINIHVWCGYFEEIFYEASLDGSGWKGFTRDYHQDEGAYAEDKYEIDINEYKEDLLQYKDKEFKFEETKEVYNLILEFLEYALNQNETVIGYRQNIRLSLCHA